MTKRHEALMIGNGAVIFFIGLMSGYLFLFHLIGELSIWPIPGSIKIQLPADDRAWRAAHTGNIMNALMLIGAGLSLSRLRLSAAAEKWVCWGLIVSAWGNLGFYAFSAMGATGRGLSFGANRFGGGDLLSTLTFLVAYPGSVASRGVRRLARTLIEERQPRARRAEVHRVRRRHVEVDDPIDITLRHLVRQDEKNLIEVVGKQNSGEGHQGDHKFFAHKKFLIFIVN